jgi:hypothetical protein
MSDSTTTTPMTNPTPSPAPAAGEMAQQADPERRNGGLDGHAAQLASASRIFAAEYALQPSRWEESLRFLLEAADEYRAAAAPPPAPEPERAGADAMREAALRALREATAALEAFPRRGATCRWCDRVSCNCPEHYFIRLVRDHGPTIRAALAREVPRG